MVLATVASLGITAIFALHVARMVFGFPAIKQEGATLFLYIFPFATYKISDIVSMDFDSRDLIIETSKRGTRRVRLALLCNDDEQIRCLAEHRRF
jgi:hypothetical protein